MRIIQKALITTAVAAFVAAPAAAVTYPAIQSTIKYTKISTTKAQGMGNYARATSSVPLFFGLHAATSASTPRPPSRITRPRSGRARGLGSLRPRRAWRPR